MRDELDKQLCEKYPKIFVDRHRSPMETCMCWGFPGDGWYWLIDNLCSMIQWRIDQQIRENERNIEYNLMMAEALAGNFTKFDKYYGAIGENYLKDRRKNLLSERTNIEIKDVHQFVAEQVKSKFGGLRFYAHGGDDVTNAYISFAESLSYSICEECGSTKNVSQTKGWVETLCKECIEKTIESTKKKKNQQHDMGGPLTP